MPCHLHSDVHIATYIAMYTSTNMPKACIPAIYMPAYNLHDLLRRSTNPRFDLFLCRHCRAGLY